MNYRLEEKSTRDLHIEALAHGEVRDMTIDNIAYNGLRCVLVYMHDYLPEAGKFREKLIEYGKKNAKRDENGKEIIEYRYVEPYVGRQVFMSAIEDHLKTININKKNIELRTQVSIREYINNHVDLNENFQTWLEMIGDTSTYGLWDIAINITIYRVGRYSYYAVEPFCEYFNPKMDCSK